VADYYEAQIDYAGSGGAARITKTARHALYTRVGRDADPANGLRVRNADEGIQTVTRQLLVHMLNDLAKDRAFNPNAPPPQATPVASVSTDAAPASLAPTAAAPEATAAPAAD
ncbi:MAG: hypothetical protein ABW199_07965, partial [Caulobacterales bacterium]